MEGELIEVPVYLNEKNIIGFQTTLQYDQDKLELIDVKNGILSEPNFGKTKLKQGHTKYFF